MNMNTSMQTIVNNRNDTQEDNTDKQKIIEAINFVTSLVDVFIITEQKVLSFSKHMLVDVHKIHTLLGGRGVSRNSDGLYKK